MRRGISIPPFTDTATLVSLAVAAEHAGWDGVFFWDHLVWSRQLGLPVHDPWVLLGAVAARTERVQLGTMVTPLARRRPQVLAKQLTTLDHLSDGRAVLGVGLGEPADTDFAAFGDPADPRERAILLDDGLQVLDGLLRGPVVHRGDRFRVVSEMRPRPVQQPRPPVWVAAVAPHRRPLARAVRWDGVVPLGPGKVLEPAELVDYLSAVDRPSNWEVVAARADGVGADEYAAVGATWLIEAAWPDSGWVGELRVLIDKGPS
jgi:alkanesulfonate monooxygenase SsuD/methylene tetrahydromethanopterin reductase-like flavin-dependent oxidoreductase (luciferase family)